MGEEVGEEGRWGRKKGGRGREVVEEGRWRRKEVWFTLLQGLAGPPPVEVGPASHFHS